MRAIHHYCYFGALALAVSQLACHAANEKKEPTRARTGSVLLEKKLLQITERAGYQLVDYDSCPDSPDSCTRIVVKTWDEEVLDYEITETPCDEDEENCLGGFTVRQYSGDKTRYQSPLRPNRANMKRAARPQSQAKLESPVRDSIVFNGGHKTNPAVLVSARIDEPGGRKKRCSNWEGSTSETARIDLGKNLVSNIVGDDCDSEIAVFAENGGARLINPHGDWSKYTDSLVVSLDPVVSIPTAVWVVQPQRDFSRTRASLEAEFNVANEILAQSRCGIRVNPVVIHDKSDTLTAANEPLGCSSIDSVLKHVGYDAGKMNVYVVDDLGNDTSEGAACKAESSNVIIVRSSGREQSVLVDEFALWLDLEQSSRKSRPLVGNYNALHDKSQVQNRFSAGQCYRMNFSKGSYINKHGLRNGPVKNCGNSQTADRQCPALNIEF